MAEVKHPLNSPELQVQMKSTAVLTPHNEAMYEAGKKMLTDSITVGRDYSKFMITLSTGGIPIYLGLLKFVLPNNASLDIQARLIVFSPAFVFLLASLVFTFAYYPKGDCFSLDILEEIQNAYSSTLRRRRRITNTGLGLFLLANLFGIIIIIVRI